MRNHTLKEYVSAPVAKPLALTAFAVSVLFAANPAQAITINVGTGLDVSNNLIQTGGQNDAHRTVDNLATPAQTVYPDNPDWYGGWLANGPNSTWIARNANTSANGVGTYTRSFDLTGFDLSTVSIVGSWAVDDNGILALNGHQLATLSAGAWGNLTPFSVDAASGFFHSGQNQLTIDIVNPTDNYLEGARLEGSLVGVAVPWETDALPLIGSTVIFGFGIWAKRRFAQNKLKNLDPLDKE